MKEYEDNSSQRSKQQKDMFYEQKNREVSGSGGGDKYSREYPPNNYEG